MAIPQRSLPSLDDLRKYYVGRDTAGVPKPAVILDRAKMRRHCDSLFRAVESLGVGFRAHIKTHKTHEGVRMQVGDRKDVKLVVSTLAELEFILPLFQEYIAAGRMVNVLYGIPLPPSQAQRLAQLGRELGHGIISVLVDNVAQLDGVRRFRTEAGFHLDVYIKVDTGYHRAGLPPAFVNKDGLVTELMRLERNSEACLVGLYSHSSLSYNDTTPAQAMQNLEGEITGCLEALRSNATLFDEDKNITISVGASPQVTAIENLMKSGTLAGELSEPAEHLRQVIQGVARNDDGAHGRLRTQLELHAGVYSILDMQQLSTRSRPDLGSCEEEVAISVAAEVCSVYNSDERDQPEALVAVGTLGLGREPCPSYPGWGVVDREACGLEAGKGRRMIVTRISQEHCIVAWEVGSTKGQSSAGEQPPIPLEVGQTVRIYPNHACITGALYGWYLVVDSSRNDEESSQVVDVWQRASGW